MNKNLIISLLLICFSWVAHAESRDPYSSDSIFWLKSEWINQDGNKIQLKELAKTPTILSMVFLGCKYSCPITIQDMKDMEQKIKSHTKNYRMVLISIDPDRDTPKAMKKFMKDRSLDPNHWILLSSTPENIRELAAALGFNYKKDKAMEFAHSMLTWIFDTQGVKRFTRAGQKETVDETAQNFLKVLP